jgi:hypothetical protein
MSLMNKFKIPVVLSGVVLVAGMFAFMPAQKASIVHMTINHRFVSRAKSISSTGLFNH